MTIDDLLAQVRQEFTSLEGRLNEANSMLGECYIARQAAEQEAERLSRQASTLPLVIGLAARNSPRPEMPIYHVRARWSDLEPEPGVFAEQNAITEAISSGYAFRVRLDCGRYAPGWVKNEVGSVTLYEPQGGMTDTIPRWWTDRYRALYERLLRWLASRYDGVIPALFGGAAMTFYNEPCLRQLAHLPNRQALKAAGYTWQADIEAQVAFIQMQHDIFKRTRLAYAFNPYQRLNADGSYTFDMGLTRTLMETVRRVPTSIIQNNSLRIPVQSNGGYDELYAMLREFGHPLSFQTAAINRVGDLDATVDTAIEWGAHLVEIPDGGMCSDPMRRTGSLMMNAMR